MKQFINMSKNYKAAIQEFWRFKRVTLQIQEVSRASFNCCLTELYLQNNDILSISGQFVL